MKKLRFLIILLFCTYSLATAADDSKTPSFTEFLSLETPGSPVISPDGSKVLYTASSAHWNSNRFITQIYIIDVKTGESRQLTYSDGSSSNPGWSPDGRYISFTATRGSRAKRQVHILPVSGGEAREATASKTGVQSYAWSPDGAWLAYTDNDIENQALQERTQELGSFEYIEEEVNHARLRIVKVDSGEEKTLVSRDDLHVNGFSWRPDGKMIVFNATPDDLRLNASKSDIYLVDVENGDISALVTLPALENGATWSPDGTKVAFGTIRTEQYFLNVDIAVCDVASGEIKILTKDFDESPTELFWNEQGLMFAAQVGIESRLFRLGEDGAISPVNDATYAQVNSFSFSSGGKTMAFIGYGPDVFHEIYISPAAEYKPRKITDFGAQVAEWELATKEAISWKSTDGTEITGVLTKPVDFDPTKKYPLFVLIHGGPIDISVPSLYNRYGRLYPIEQFVAKGAVVLEPNYRGGAGFGEKFRSLDYRNLGIGEYWDVISGVDYLIEQGFVDSERVCSIGWSHGGFVSAFVSTYSDRFLAASVGAGVSDWVEYYIGTDMTPFTIHYMGATPWADPEIYAKASPMTYINKARTPTLIQHGSNDNRIPINNAYKLFRGLKDVGVPVRFIVYKGFGHSLSRPKERRASLTHNWEWFSKYVWGEDPENGSEENNAEN